MREGHEDRDLIKKRPDESPGRTFLHDLSFVGAQLYPACPELRRERSRRDAVPFLHGAGETLVDSGEVKPTNARAKENVLNPEVVSVMMKSGKGSTLKTVACGSRLCILLPQGIRQFA